VPGVGVETDRGVGSVVTTGVDDAAAPAAGTAVDVDVPLESPSPPVQAATQIDAQTTPTVRIRRGMDIDEVYRLAVLRHDAPLRPYSASSRAWRCSS
jgi:hypothetical protein